jgi:hypothetical protein
MADTSTEVNLDRVDGVIPQNHHLMGAIMKIAIFARWMPNLETEKWVQGC